MRVEGKPLSLPSGLGEARLVKSVFKVGNVRVRIGEQNSTSKKNEKRVVTDG
jgi:hypothetical protein